MQGGHGPQGTQPERHTPVGDEALEADQTASTPPRKWWGPEWLRRLLFCIKWLAKKPDSVDWARATDPDRNAEGRLPEDEGIEIPAIWVTEAYTPSTLAGLLGGLEGLQSTRGAEDGQELKKWISDVRHGTLRGTRYLGRIRDQSKSDLLTDSIADLPEGIEAVMPVMTANSPSLTVLTTRFVLNDAAAARLGQILRRDYTTTRTCRERISFRKLARYVVYGGTFWFPAHGMLTPDWARQKAAQEYLKQLESSCRGWVSSLFPGTFASLERGVLPTAVLFVTEHSTPFDPESERIRSFDGIGIDRGFDKWTSSQWPAGRLALPSTFGGNERRLTIAVRRGDAFAPSEYTGDHKSNWTIAWRASELLEGFLARWTITEILGAYERTIAQLRDESAQRTSFRPVRDYRALRSHAQTVLHDVHTLANEIRDFADDKSRYHWHAIEWEQIAPRTQEKLNLLEEMRIQQRKWAVTLSESASSISSTLLITGQITSTISNVRMQRLVIFLTGVSLLVAAAAAYFAYLAYFANVS